MRKPLVIVESPTKARTISRYLGDNFTVISSMGHIRDLPRNAKELPNEHKGTKRNNLGIDPDFAPIYIIPSKKRAYVEKLRRALAKASALYLATDDDREGEAIAWHIYDELAPTLPVQRVTFREVTKSAVLDAIAGPRPIDEDLVHAQEARRVLDRLIGWSLSPVLWKKIRPKLSTGRVQSVATRLVVEREKERISFVSRTSFDIEAVFRPKAVDTPDIPAQLTSIDGIPLPNPHDFRLHTDIPSETTPIPTDPSPTSTPADCKSSSTKPSSPSSASAKDSPTDRPSDRAPLPTPLSAPLPMPVQSLLDRETATTLAHHLAHQPSHIIATTTTSWQQKPPPPFTTAALQQAADRRLGLSPVRTMRTAQELYENGWITYPRTDSVKLSLAAATALHTEAKRRYGEKLVTPHPRRHFPQTHSNARQEAHEAIRPAGRPFLTPDKARPRLNSTEHNLYTLIWQRSLASQMRNATGTENTRQIKTVTAQGQVCVFTSTERRLLSPGFRASHTTQADEKNDHSAWSKKVPDTSRTEKTRDTTPDGTPDTTSDTQELICLTATPRAKTNTPPPRYSEGDLVAALEKRGIGRPSTYAPITRALHEHGYVFSKGGKLVPTWIAFCVVSLLQTYFPDLVSDELTAKMEQDLDKIAQGNLNHSAWLHAFYHGEEATAAHPGLPAGHETESDTTQNTTQEQAQQNRSFRIGLCALVEDDRVAGIDAKEVNTIRLPQTGEEEAIIVRVGRKNIYLVRGEETAPLPESLEPDLLDRKKAEKLLASATIEGKERLLGRHPVTGETITLRKGAYGPYVELLQGSDTPKRASLFKHMRFTTVTLEDALCALSLPRLIGTVEGEKIIGKNGRYGPYLVKGKETRDLLQEAQLLTISLEEAVALFVAPKPRRPRRRKSKPTFISKSDLGVSHIVRKGQRKKRPHQK